MLIFRKLVLRCCKLVIYLLLLTTDNNLFTDASYNDIEEARLVKHLLDGYTQVVRPVRNYQDTVNLEMTLTVIQLVDMDEVNEIMTLNVWFNNKWRDEFLTWNPEDFDNLTTTTIDSFLIWKPDITLHNNANEEFSNGVLKTKASISYDGTVRWDAPAILKSACQLDPLYFPFDKQNCSLKLGSLTYNENQLNITCPYEEGDTSAFQSSGEWTLKSAPIVRYVSNYLCCDEVYPNLYFYVILKRQPLFYLLNLIFPCILISALVLLGFYLPSDAGEKVTLTITILLALNVFLLLVAETMPPTSKVVPLIGQYFILNIVLVGICTSITIIILAFHHHSDSTQVPKWLHTLVLVKLSNLLNNGNPSSNSRPISNSKDLPNTGSKQRQDVRPSERLSTGVDNPVFEYDNERVLVTAADITISPSTESFASCDEDLENSSNMLESYIQSIANSVFGIGRLIRSDIKRKKRATQWMAVARVLDRFFMIVFGVGQLLITVITLSLAAANQTVF